MNDLVSTEQQGGIPGDALPTQLVLPEELSFEAWQEGMNILFALGKGCMWWIGDACNYGESHYGEKYTQALENGDFEYSTLTNAAWVCRSVAPEIRRKELSFSHHDAVASLDNQEEQKEWLDQAVENNWTRDQLRKEISKAKRLEHDGGGGDGGGGEPSSSPPVTPPDDIQGEGKYRYAMKGTTAELVECYDDPPWTKDSGVVLPVVIGRFECSGDETWDGRFPSECFAIEACKALNSAFDHPELEASETPDAAA